MHLNDLFPYLLIILFLTELAVNQHDHHVRPNFGWLLSKALNKVNKSLALTDENHVNRHTTQQHQVTLTIKRTLPKLQIF